MGLQIRLRTALRITHRISLRASLSVPLSAVPWLRLSALQSRVARLRITLRISAWRKSPPLLCHRTLPCRNRSLDRSRRRQALGMLTDNLLRHFQNFAFSAIGKLAMGLIQGEPECLAHFIAHIRTNLSQPYGSVEEQVEADGLGDMLPATPRADVQISNCRKPEQAQAAYAGFLKHLAIGALLWGFPLVHSALRQREDRAFRTRLRAPRDSVGVDDIRLDNGNLPCSANMPEHDAASRRFVHGFVRGLLASRSGFMHCFLGSRQIGHRWQT